MNLTFNSYDNFNSSYSLEIEGSVTFGCPVKTKKLNFQNAAQLLCSPLEKYNMHTHNVDLFISRSHLEQIIEFFLSVFTQFTEFSDKIICHYSEKKEFKPPNSCVRDLGCYRSTSKTQVRDRMFKLTPIHASVIYQIP